MTLPETIREAMQEYRHACEACLYDHATNADVRHRIEAKAALESAILSALSAAREGALREAVTEAEDEEAIYREHAALLDAGGHRHGALGDTHGALGCRAVRDRILALASRPAPRTEEDR